MKNTDIKGFTLLELLISMALSIAIFSTIIQLISSSRSTFNSQQELTTILENGRFATEYLSTVLRQATFEIRENTLTAIQGFPTTPIVSIAGCEEDRSDDGTLNDSCRVKGIKISGDLITIKFDSPLNYPTDCFGNDNVMNITNQFYVKPDSTNVSNAYPNGIPSLFCRSNAEGITNGSGRFTERALISNVENMQILYGLDIDDDKVANRYRKFNQFANHESSKIVSLQIGILMTGSSNTRQTDDNAEYQLAKQTIPGNGDRVLRRSFNLTVTLRNRM